MGIRNVAIGVCLMAILAVNFAVPLPVEPVTHIAFGSCNAHNRDQKIWKSIIDASPDLFVWLGDVVYADSPILPLISTSSPLDVMASKFEAQKTSPLYSQLRSTTPIVGVWVCKGPNWENAKFGQQTKTDLFLALLVILGRP